MECSRRVTDRFRIATLLLLALLLIAACGQNQGTGAATTAPSETQIPQTTETEQATAETEQATTSPQGQGDTQATSAAATGGDDLLAEVKSRGSLLIATDANYKPQSFKTPDGSWEGFDIEVAREIAKRLGVEAEFLDISFDVVTAGNWNGRWDINVGSMTVTPERKKALYFTTPYYYTPAAFAVHTDSQATSASDLNGKKIGVGAATTYLDYLQGNLTLEGEEVQTPAPQADVQVYDTDQLALTDLALGNGTRLDAVVTALPTIEDSIKGGQPFKVLGEPVYYEQLAVALDMNSQLDSKSLADEISRIIDEMHQDGTLTTLSNKYYGIDLTKKQ